MSNLGAYQVMTTVAKKVGGPVVLGVVTFFSGYVVLRPTEAGVKSIVRAIRSRNVPCTTKGRVFRAKANGEEGDLSLHVGDEYRVLECDGDAILIEVLGNSGNPYFASSDFLRSVSDFPEDNATGNE